MKDFFKSIGKALVYFLVYFGLQIVVSGIYGVVLSTKLTMQIMATGEELDMVALTEQLTAQAMSAAMMLTMISGLIALLVYWIVSLIRKKDLFVQLEIKSFPGIGIVPIALAGISFNLIVSLGFFSLPFPQSWIDSYAANSAVIGDGNKVIGWLATVLVAPIVEEVVFRGYMYTRLKKGMPLAAAAVITSLTFALVHGTMIWGIYTFVFSLLLIWTFEKYHSLAANIVFHMAFNLAGMGLSLITADGKVLTIVLFVISVVVFAGSMYWNKKITDKIVVQSVEEENRGPEPAEM